MVKKLPKNRHLDSTNKIQVKMEYDNYITKQELVGQWGVDWY